MLAHCIVQTLAMVLRFMSPEWYSGTCATDPLCGKVKPRNPILSLPSEVMLWFRDDMTLPKKEKDRCCTVASDMCTDQFRGHFCNWRGSNNTDNSNKGRTIRRRRLFKSWHDDLGVKRYARWWTNFNENEVSSYQNWMQAVPQPTPQVGVSFSIKARRTRWQIKRTEGKKVRVWEDVCLNLFLTLRLSHFVLQNWAEKTHNLQCLVFMGCQAVPHGPEIEYRVYV